MVQDSIEPESVALGIDLGGTKIAGALFNSGGMVSPKKVSYLENINGQQIVNQVFGLIQFFLEWSGKNNMQVKSIGMAIPGIYSTHTGRVWAPNLPGWEDYPLLEELKDEHPDLDISIDNDRACYILGETWKGSATGCKHAIYLAVGTGIGTGILIDGKVLRGADDIAGSIGWMAITDPHIPQYKKHGCFEYHASGSGLLRMANDFQMPDIEQLTTPDIFKAFDKGNPIAKQVIEQAIRFWGKASANLVSLFNPEIIIFGGGVFGPALQFLDEIYGEAKKWAQPISIDKVKFMPSKLGVDAGLYGAGIQALQTKPI